MFFAVASKSATYSYLSKASGYPRQSRPGILHEVSIDIEIRWWYQSVGQV